MFSYPRKKFKICKELDGRYESNTLLLKKKQQKKIIK